MTDCVQTWQAPPLNLTLLENDAHIWLATLEQPKACFQLLAQTLSEDERLRAERFYFERDRQRFVVGRGILRTILGCYLGIEPAAVKFCYGHRGKPALTKTHNWLRFNLSHSQGLALYAITRDQEVGIDLEYLRPLAEAKQIATRYFSSQESAVLQTLPANEQLVAFFNCWTRKEAYIKALGDGLAVPLNQFDVSLTVNEPARILSIKGDPSAAKNWFLHALTPAPDYVGALAVAGQNWQLKYWQWSESLLRIQ